MKTKTSTSIPRIPTTERGKQLARIAIARDVLKQLPYWNVRQGIYFGTVKELPAGKDLRTVLKELPKKECSVCALGSCFLSFVNKYDRVTTGYGGTSINTIFTSLKLIFEHQQLRLIEYAFEHRCSHPEGDFWEVYANDNKECLRAITENIIANKGTFDASSYLAKWEERKEKLNANN